MPVRVLLFILPSFWVPAAAAIDLPPGEGRELIQAQCGVCHSLALVVQNRMTESDWDSTITWMQETQNLWDLPPAMRKTMVTYLGTHFGPDQKTSALVRARANPLPIETLPAKDAAK